MRLMPRCNMAVLSRVLAERREKDTVMKFKASYLDPDAVLMSEICQFRRYKTYGVNSLGMGLPFG